MNRLTKSYNPPELSLDELRAYQAGQLSDLARNRVERLMLDNPFYADALDGLEALQQVGSSLQTHTQELHEALQERVHESATTRRLMPLWVTCLVASVLLVISVAIYLIFRPTAPQQRSGSVGFQPIEPGTILLNPADLGPAVNMPAIAAARGTSSLPKSAGVAETIASATLSVQAGVGQKAEPAVRWKRPSRRLEPQADGVREVVISRTDPFAIDQDIITPQVDQEVNNRRQVNTERAFLR